MVAIRNFRISTNDPDEICSTELADSIALNRIDLADTKMADTIGTSLLLTDNICNVAPSYVLKNEYIFHFFTLFPNASDLAGFYCLCFEIINCIRRMH